MQAPPINDRLVALAPGGIPLGVAIWLLGAHGDRYAPTVLGLALVAFSLYFILYPPKGAAEGG